MRREPWTVPEDWPRAITIGGLPGTGTTTACGTIEQRTGLRYVYAGELFRKMAQERGMTLAEFGAYAEQHPEIDRALDAKQVELLKGPPLLLEGRLSGFLAYRDHVPAYKVWFTCDGHERARRVVEREGGSSDERLAEMRQREASERKRYLEFYSYDIGDLSVYDLVLDTTRLGKSETVDRILEAYRRKPGLMDRLLRRR